MNRINNAPRQAKVQRNSRACEACGWEPPEVLHDGTGLVPILHGHHVIPIACEGVDKPRNIAVLCPNCHAIAHRLGKMVRVKYGREKVWIGPETRAQLIGEVVLVSFPEHWHYYVENGRGLHLLQAIIGKLKESADFHTLTKFPVRQRGGKS